MSARLEIYNPPSGPVSDFKSVNPTKGIELFAIETITPADLRLPATGLTLVYEDLGIGVAYNSGTAAPPLTMTR